MREGFILKYPTEQKKEGPFRDAEGNLRENQLDNVMLLARKEEGKEMYRDHLARIDEGRIHLVTAVEGFRRDAVGTADSSASAVEVTMQKETRSYVPPSIDEASTLSNLSDTLSRAIVLLEGDVQISKDLRLEIERNKAKFELGVLHNNLSMVMEAGGNLKKLLQNAAYHFDRFNAKNGEEYSEANVAFDRDSLNVSSATASAIVHKAVLFDISVDEALRKVDAMGEEAEAKQGRKIELMPDHSSHRKAA